MVTQELCENLRERGLWIEFHGASPTAAKAELIRMYEPLTRSIASRMYGRRIDDSVAFSDYLQYGQIGLLEALSRFDPTRGIAFSTFASSRIRGAILNGLAKESESASQNHFWRVHAHDRVDSLFTALAPDADRISLAQIAMITVGLALGALLEESGDSFEPADPHPASNPYAVNELVQLCSAVEKLMARLPENERLVIRGHYIEHLEFQRLAQRMSITKGRVSQIHARALLRLRGWLEERPSLDCKL
jgi:RNA polymerase sigma factor for flagellar operon FliA